MGTVGRLASLNGPSPLSPHSVTIDPLLFSFLKYLCMYYPPSRRTPRLA